MKKFTPRRSFLKTVLASPALTLTGGMLLNTTSSTAQTSPAQGVGSKLRVSLNAYSFNEPLTKKTMTLDDLLNFCAENNFDAVDLTGYYFPGYPAVPEDEYIFHLKQKAHRLGLDISGTGIRNDFTNPDKGKRKDDTKLIKKWIECAAKLGAPVIRIFSGLNIPEGHTWDEVTTWMVKDMKECADYGKQYGVIVAIQNHNDFIKTAEQAQKIIEQVNSDWFGLVLDIGSYRTGDPYKQIEQTAKYAVNWQLKELMFLDNREQKTDLQKVISIIKASGYRGYVPIETLGAGDPKIKVPVFLAEVRKALALNGL
ncbi:sugar phosphate isomerase/epimerase family protein [Segetibacter aerophilus]|uniref:Xylose isomerase n=1 Tax=Segetibacter aerophilus TaxID=670293 RepID=A0A512BDP2_9BACT|nr:sugar phosphate isomerase/epimerase family protein [Segetibacter aerophilus]GEO10083.1 xylose isomerase [Segetibacter aerophilus]